MTFHNYSFGPILVNFNPSFSEVLSFYLLSSDFEARFLQMNSSERQQKAKIIFQKLELIGFSENVRNEVKKELPKLNHDSFKLPVRQVKMKFSCKKLISTVGRSNLQGSPY